MLLMQNLCNYGAQDLEGQTPFHVAAQRGHFSVVQELLMRVASESSSLDPEPPQPRTRAQRCAAPDCRQCNSTVVAGGRGPGGGGDVERQAAVLEVGDVHGRTPLHLAAEGGYEAVAELLLQAGADVNGRNKAGLAPLHIAAIRGDEGMVRLLLDFNADYLTPIRIG